MWWRAMAPAWRANCSPSRRLEGSRWKFEMARCRSRVQAIIDRVTSSRHVDLVHMHGLDFASYAVPASIPVLVTLHLPIDWYEPECWSRFGARAQFCCVSQTQRGGCGPAMRGVSVVENGVALPPLPARRRKGEFALVMGRICPEKNAAAALEAGTLARTRVLLAGQAFPYREHRRYLQEMIEPLLDRARGDLDHAFLGPVASAQRRQLLAEAKCLLHPTLAPETSSLVAMEAMAAGTPVIAYRSGALPEIVEEGVTGSWSTAWKRWRMPSRGCMRCLRTRAGWRRSGASAENAWSQAISPCTRPCSGRTSVAMRNAHYAIVRSNEELEALLPAWADLWQRDPEAMPFQRPEWLLPWWRQFGSSNPRVITINGESCSRMSAVAMAELPRKIRRNAMYYRNRALRLGSLRLTMADACTGTTHFRLWNVCIHLAGRRAERPACWPMPVCLRGIARHCRCLSAADACDCARFASEMRCWVCFTL